MKEFVRRKGYVELYGLYKLPYPSARFRLSMCRGDQGGAKLEFKRSNGDIWNFDTGRWEPMRQATLFGWWLDWLYDELMLVARYYKQDWMRRALVKEGR